MDFKITRKYVAAAEILARDIASVRPLARLLWFYGLEQLEALRRCPVNGRLFRRDD